MKNYKLTLCYDGSRYKGWQKLKGVSGTIQGRLEELLSRLLEQEISVHGSGRTDSGVHALAQVCSFRAETNMDTNIMLTKLREYLPEDIGAVSLEEADERFHARLSCREKTYVYRVWNSTSPNVFERRYTYSFPLELDMEAMEKAASYMLGRQDFAAFTTRAAAKKSTVRELREIKLEKKGEELRMSFTGDGFLYNMVRIMSGTLLEVGRGKLNAEDIPAILSSKKRENAGFTAPAHGLVLHDVKY